MLSFIVLLCVLRSVLLPLKAVAMNVLSVAAAYGVLVIVFQWGWFDGFLGFESLGYVQAITPALLLAIVFGLSMDYEVFMLSRIKERYQATGDNRRAVAEGLQASAKTISSAALIMVAVFAIFAGTGIPQIKEIGVGLAVAIALDATVVRLILVPTTMEMMGNANWWLPRWLDRILPDMDFESSEATPKHATPQPWRPYDVQDRAHHRLFDRHRALDGQAAGRRRVDRLRDRAPDRPRSRTSRPTAAARSRSTSPTRTRWSPPCAPSRRPRARSARSSTTPASRRSGRSRRVPMDRVRALFETNVFGPVRLAQLVLPGMREEGGGRIVTVGSMNGRFTWPGTGYYCATKHALEAISDALRHEARPFGVDTVLIEPGFVKTPLGKTAAGRRVEGDDGPYGELQRGRRRRRAHLHHRRARASSRARRRRSPRSSRRRSTASKPRARYRVAPLGGRVHDHAQGAAGRRLRRHAALADAVTYTWRVKNAAISSLRSET